MFEHVSHPEYAYGMAFLAPPLARGLLLRFDIDEDDFDLEPNILFALAAEEDCSSEEQDDKQDVIEDESSSIPESVVEPPEAPIIPPSIPSGRTTRTSRQGRRRVWKQVPFEDGPHNYMPIPTKPVRRPVDYFRDYFDDDFIEKFLIRSILTLRNALHVVEGDSAPDSERVTFYGRSNR
ncbi:hypothetical protein EVAR_55131_1 [Eumeta japonica]|uniref:Uncharacterized protein n=1 Tax=Eumeta variegata TaxID=151549 RepID=A0A4C1YAH7_EUMVA|nr:hypothetical protein EVAR_55131_1 [Eumeta japonica]